MIRLIVIDSSAILERNDEESSIIDELIESFLRTTKDQQRFFQNTVYYSCRQD